MLVLPTLIGMTKLLKLFRQGLELKNFPTPELTVEPKATP